MAASRRRRVCLAPQVIFQVDDLEAAMEKVRQLGREDR